MGIAPATTIMGTAPGTVTIMGIALGTVTIAVGSNDDRNSSHIVRTPMLAGSEQMCGMPRWPKRRRERSERGVTQLELTLSLRSAGGCGPAFVSLRVRKTDTRPLSSTVTKFG
jgi:hypothetical protein